MMTTTTSPQCRTGSAHHRLLGRRTCLPHDSAAMVLAQASTDDFVICSASGPDADWTRNLPATSPTNRRVRHFVGSHPLVAIRRATAKDPEELA